MVTSPHVSKGKPNSRSSTIKSGTSNVEFEMKLIRAERMNYYQINIDIKLKQKNISDIIYR